MPRARCGDDCADIFPRATRQLHRPSRQSSRQQYVGVFLSRKWQVRRQQRLPPAQRAVIWHGQLEPQERQHRLQKPLRGPQAQMKHRLECEGTLDRGVRVDSRSTRSDALVVGSPSGDSSLIELEGQSASAHERLVVLWPVADPVAKCEFGLRHAAMLAAAHPRISATTSSRRSKTLPRRPSRVGQS